MVDCKIKIESIHSGEELIGLKRKSSEEIFKTISKQEDRQGRKKRTKEEFVTRYLSERRPPCLLTKEEVIIFDQYPLWKRPNKPKKPCRVDIIYSYPHENTRSLGIVEAKVEGGEGLTEAVNQLQEYQSLLNKFLKERIKIFQDVAIKKFNVKLPDNCQITQLDILAPCRWWVKQKQKEQEEIRKIKGSNIRFLCIPDVYIPEQWPQKNFLMDILQVIL